MAKNLDIKKQQVEEVYNKIVEVNPETTTKGLNTVVIEYSKLTSNEFNALRSKLFESGASLKVLKNTLVKILFKKFNVEADYDNLTLEGQNAILVADKEFVGSVKTIADYLKKNAKGVFKLGVLEGNVINDKEVLELSKLPSKQVLVGQTLAGFNTPIRNFVYTLNGVQTNFVRVLQGIADKK